MPAHFAHRSRDRGKGLALGGFLLALALHAAAGPAGAGPRVEADPNKSYVITPEAGPYVICAASFTGPGAADRAHQVVLCLRQRDNLPAYVMNWGEEQRRQQREYVEQMKRQNPEARVKTVRLEEQCGVLIGGYKDLDAARKDLDRVRKLEPPDVDLEKVVVPDFEKKGYQLYAVSPFINAIAVPNPTVPKAPAAEKKDDPFLKKLNADEEYSLLKLNHPYTMAVKVYAGVSCIQSRSSSSPFLDVLGLGKKAGDVLNASAMQAHETARVLRLLGYEAYVLHDRTCSYVTVGGFRSWNDEQMATLRDKFLNDKRMLPMQLSPEVAPMRVPRPGG